ncbi:MAG: helix-turn-helix transcriptional regulator [Balneolaceae bacterium]|nr:helix-turn-helix transcriptional regulator [Balneolaceae bacterium]
MKPLQSLSYTVFLLELDLLYTHSGISRYRSPITAETDHSARQGNQPDVSEPEIGRILLYIDKHLSEDLKLDDLAAEIQISKFQLIRRFREEMDSTPWQYLIQQRIEKCKYLLEEGYAPAQVAAEAGFYDQSHLNHVFKESVGITPKKYQENNFKNRN